MDSDEEINVGALMEDAYFDDADLDEAEWWVDLIQKNPDMQSILNGIKIKAVTEVNLPLLNQICRGDVIRTRDLRSPRPLRYRAAPLPEAFVFRKRVQRYYKYLIYANFNAKYSEKILH